VKQRGLREREEKAKRRKMSGWTGLTPAAKRGRRDRPARWQTIFQRREKKTVQIGSNVLIRKKKKTQVHHRKGGGERGWSSSSRTGFLGKGESRN